MFTHVGLLVNGGRWHQVLIKLDRMVWLVAKQKLKGYSRQYFFNIKEMQLRLRPKIVWLALLIKRVIFVNHRQCVLKCGRLFLNCDSIYICDEKLHADTLCLNLLACHILRSANDARNFYELDTLRFYFRSKPSWSVRKYSELSSRCDCCCRWVQYAAFFFFFWSLYWITFMLILFFRCTVTPVGLNTFEKIINAWCSQSLLIKKRLNSNFEMTDIFAPSFLVGEGNVDIFIHQN